jgi:Raf kinase inhibitor-like YbhB/YbcL family protein
MKFTTATRSALAVVACVLTVMLTQAEAQPPSGPRMMVTSTAFEDGGVVPEKYAARGDNVQPDFTFSDVPDSAVSIAVIFHDIDVALPGGTEDVLHWVAWNIPASAGRIPEGRLPDGAVQGANITQQPSYMGPGAPVGERYHHYVFEFYALSENLSLPASASRDELLAAMAGKIVDKAAYVGRYRGSN